MSERTETLALAKQLLDEPNTDPDDDLPVARGTGVPISGKVKQ